MGFIVYKLYYSIIIYIYPKYTLIGDILRELISVNDITTYDGFDRDRIYFLSVLRMKGRKDATVTTYNEALKSVYRTLSSMGLGDPRSLTSDDIVQLRDAMTVSETSRKLYLIVLGRFLEVLGLDNIVKSADLLWNHTEPRRLFISVDEFKAMMVGCSSIERVVMMLGAYMGLRRSEICSVNLSDFDGNVLTVRGKGHGMTGKVSHLKVPRPVMSAIQSYLMERDGDGDALLMIDGKRVSSRMIGSMISRIAKRNGVRMTPHSLRRLYATTLYDAGVDLNTIRILMRHNSIATTIACYIDVHQTNRDKAVDMLCSMLGR